MTMQDNARTKSKIPFVGLHAHSVAGSVFDGFGYPQDHMNFAYQNGMNALALTDHGNMNGMSYGVGNMSISDKDLASMSQGDHLRSRKSPQSNKSPSGRNSNNAVIYK